MRRILKWLAIILGGLLGLLVVIAAVLMFTGGRRLTRQYEVEPGTVEVDADPAVIERGQYLASVSCIGCHGDDLAGADFFDDPALGSIPAANLTAGAGGIGGVYSDADFVRAIRHGVDNEGRPLAIMPSKAYWHFSDEDLGAIIAYVKSVPAVDNDLGEKEFRPMGRLLVGAGMLDILSAEAIDHSAPRPAPRARAVDAGYGEYLVNTGDCRQCHGADLSGGNSGEPGAPDGPDLTALAGWTEAAFITAMRTGVSPEGRELDAAYMPWKEAARMTDDDLTALWLHLQSQSVAESNVEQ